MPQLKIAAVLVVAIILQLSLRAVWLPLSYIDFPLLVVVYIALQRDAWKALIVGTIAGLVVDAASGGLIGAGGFSKTLTAYIVFLAATRINLENPLLRIPVLAAAAVMDAAIYVFWHRSLGYPPLAPFVQTLSYRLIGTTIVGTIVLKFEDTSQNLRARLRAIQIIVILMLSVLGVRLYVLQVVRGQSYAELAENQRRRRLPIPAPRGVIFDRAGRVLADSRPIYNVILSREDVRGKDLTSLAKPLADALAVDGDILRDRFDQVKSQPAFESILVKQGANPGDIAWVEAHVLEFPELRVELQPQRSYPANGMLAHVLGYVGEINTEQLKQPSYKDKGLKPGDTIGQSGLEQIYDDYLRGKDGYREVIVDSRGRIQDEIETVPPQPGRDLITTIDLDLQQTAEEQLA